MKVALILPDSSLAERYNKAIAHVAGNLPPLGLLGIGTVLKQAGHEVLVLDGTMLSRAELLRRAHQFFPQVIGISAMTCMWPKVATLSTALKSIIPDAHIIVGGVHASILKTRALDDVASIDAVAWGEGEASMLEYVAAARSPASTSPIDGIAYRAPAGGIIVGRDRPPLKDLDSLPIPDRSLIPLADYVSSFEQYKALPVTNMVTARGCPFKCTFCLPTLLGPGVRYRSVEKVLAEIFYLVDTQGIRDIAFWDDTFTLNKERVLSISARLAAAKRDLVWSAQARADCVTPDMLDAMAKAGCWKLFYGVESLVQKNLDVLKKGETVEQIFKAIALTRQAGIEVEASFIFGIPGETYQDGLETIRLAKILDPDYAKFFPLSPYGEFRHRLEGQGIFLTADEGRFTGNNITFVPNSMTREELSRLYFTAYREFYVRPAMIWRRVRKSVSSRQEMRKSLNGLFAVASFLSAEARQGLRGALA